MIANCAAAEDFLPPMKTKPMTKRLLTPANSAATSAPPASAQTDPASPIHRAETTPSASPSPAPTLHLHNAAAVPSRHQFVAQSLQSYPWLVFSSQSAQRIAHSKLGRIAPNCPPFFPCSSRSQLFVRSISKTYRPESRTCHPERSEGSQTSAPSRHRDDCNR
jgi:hypothetical protein